MSDVPRAATVLLRQLSDWSVFQRAAVGPCEFGGLSQETNGEGKRHRVSVVEDVDSYLVRAHHPDGRAFVAVWIRRPGLTPAGRRKGWSLDTAWRGRHIGEYAPHQITVTELATYVAGGVEAIDELAVERAQRKEAA